MSPSLQNYAAKVDFSNLEAKRIKALKPLVDYITKKVSAGAEVNLTFICTHNSRRSHFGQVWAQIAAHCFAIPLISTFSGGTEATACNYRTIKALQRAGFICKKLDEGNNPKYEIKASKYSEVMEVFSKLFDSSPNPMKNFAAIMTCDHADKNCPTIPGAEVRLPIVYIDPKKADDSPLENETYDLTCLQIACEMFWVFSTVKNKLKN